MHGLPSSKITTRKGAGTDDRRYCVGDRTERGQKKLMGR